MPRRQYGMIICSEYVPEFLDAFAEGRLKRFFEANLEFSSENPKDAADDEEREEMEEFRDEELSEAMQSIFDQYWFVTMQKLPTSCRYSLEENGLIVGIYGTIFLRIQNVIKNGGTLILAVAPCRDGARFAQDVMEGTLTEENFLLYASHWRSPELSVRARLGFKALKCDYVRGDETTIPWDMSSERAKKWFEYERRPTFWLNSPVIGKALEKHKKPIVPKKMRGAKRKAE